MVLVDFFSLTLFYATDPFLYFITIFPLHQHLSMDSSFRLELFWLHLTDKTSDQQSLTGCILRNSLVFFKHICREIPIHPYISIWTCLLHHHGDEAWVNLWKYFWHPLRCSTNSHQYQEKCGSLHWAVFSLVYSRNYSWIITLAPYVSHAHWRWLHFHGLTCIFPSNERLLLGWFY